MKNLLISFFFVISCMFMFTATSHAQSISCSRLFNIVTSEYDYKDNVNCFNSTMLSSATHYTVEGQGFVVAYIKSNEYDFRGNAYIFCGIDSYRWSSFKSAGMYGSWGEAFHKYIFDYTCNCY